jgi:hypothetical protein
MSDVCDDGEVEHLESVIDSLDAELRTLRAYKRAWERFRALYTPRQEAAIGAMDATLAEELARGGHERRD